MIELRMTPEERWEATSRVEEALAQWESRLRRPVKTVQVAPPVEGFVSSCPNWRELRPRTGRVWTSDEDEALLLEFDAGLTRMRPQNQSPAPDRGSVGEVW
jgi:hypothetical protein